jgi:hypothetical protein
MDVIPTDAADETATALVIARTNEEIMARLDWLLRRATAAEEEILTLFSELNRRRPSLPPPPADPT